MYMTMRLVTHVFGLVFAFLPFISAYAQQDTAKAFPNKPIHVIVGVAAGGGTDIIARVVSQKLSESLSQAVVVENKPGFGAIIATEYVAKAPADGYTLLLGSIGTMTVNPAVYSKLSYSPQRDFVPISMIASFPVILVVNSALPIKSIPELVAYAKANPAKSNTGGAGAVFQLVAELFKMKTGAPMEFINYKSSAEAISAVMSGDLLMTLIDLGPASGSLKAGKMRGLAVAQARRNPSFPDIPTMAEAGLANMETRFWAGFVAPAGTPAPVVRKLQDEVMRIVGLPDVRERLRALEAEPVGSTSDEFARIIAAETAQWASIAKANNIKVE
jgi:tripartite-type tricarboxylate transporter receptor subunit TctC